MIVCMLDDAQTALPRHGHRSMRTHISVQSGGRKRNRTQSHQLVQLHLQNLPSEPLNFGGQTSNIGAGDLNHRYHVRSPIQTCTMQHWPKVALIKRHNIIFGPIISQSCQPSKIGSSEPFSANQIPGTSSMATSHKCIATIEKCTTTSNKKLLLQLTRPSCAHYSRPVFSSKPKSHLG